MLCAKRKLTGRIVKWMPPPRDFIAVQLSIMAEARKRPAIFTRFCYNGRMTKVIVAAVFLVLLIVAAKVFEEFFRNRKPRFEYRRKDGVMTNAEQECFHALVSEMGPDYYFFPQIHLDAIVQPTDTRKDRFYAFRHINQKSVDFVACDKKQLRPLFVIELDDKTHKQQKRIERDQEVERILHGAGIPLIRIANRGRFEPKGLAAMVQKGTADFYTKQNQTLRDLCET
jgi:very-short-patch-repair endonuclease